jgi:hypothetical protein
MLRQYLLRHIKWSRDTFGEGALTESLLRHIAMELEEIRQRPNDLMEWVDVILLAFDGAWRAGYSPVEIVNAMVKKQAINFDRQWLLSGDDQPYEHDRTQDVDSGDRPAGFIGA